MGYYDQNYRTYRKRKGRWLAPLIIGIVIGVLFIGLVMPEFMNSTNGGDDARDQVTIETNEQNGNQPLNTSVTVDVTTQITEVVEEVTPTVVGITNIQQRSDFFEQQEGIEAGTGSGVIYKNNDGTAFVVTNHHVIEGADTVEVVLYDDTHIEAEIVGSDLFSDLAVLRMDGAAVDKVIEIGTSESIKVGEPAIAIGNPLGLYLSSTVTQGVISGTERTIPQDFNQDGRADWQAEVIQTDAAINPGNSGGALINIYGQLIGINSMKINQAAVEGIGFAIPIDHALPIIEELETTGEVTRPYLGVEIYSLDEVPQTEWRDTLNLPSEVDGGVYVWNVEPLSPADQAGLERLDVITELDGNPIMNMIDLRKVLYQEKEIGDTIQVTYYRNGERVETDIELGSQ
ncbi:S1C family serine protease [Oceanobacillus profundus]|uniref:PDZ domain-containing protein n=1 Tax=Oceanobacillus profundus TaxID=372463 RepID=A0A417YHF0_9BACI|nr:trypsin-like peptidase domain-containing protein [Oceanobacillus profundus]RHW32268.1 PDZ domain-containing protein [Oceanobacillus profundus]